MFGFFGGQENEDLNKITENFNNDPTNISNVFRELTDYFKGKNAQVIADKKSLELSIKDHKDVYDNIIQIIAKVRNEDGNYKYKTDSIISTHEFFKHFLYSLIGVNYHYSQYYNQIELKINDITKKFNGFYTCECIFGKNYEAMKKSIDDYYNHDKEIIKEFEKYIKDNKDLTTLIVNIKKLQVLSLINLCGVKIVENHSKVKNITQKITTYSKTGTPETINIIPPEIIKLLIDKTNAIANAQNIGENLEDILNFAQTEENIDLPEIRNDEKGEEPNGDISRKSAKKLPEPGKGKIMKTGQGEYYKQLSEIVMSIPTYPEMRQFISGEFGVELDFPKYQIDIEINKFMDNRDNAIKNSSKNTASLFAKNLKAYGNGITLVNSRVSNNEDLNTYADNVKKVADMLNDLLNVSDKDIDTKKVGDILKEKGYDINATIAPIKTKNMAGGSQQYHKKYLKYKAKYMQLKNN